MDTNVHQDPLTALGFDTGGPRVEIAEVVHPETIAPHVEFRAEEVDEFKFWAGVLPGCPKERIDIAGVNFSKTTNRLVADGMPTDRSGSAVRRVPTPQLGNIITLTRDRFDYLVKRLPLTIVRFGAAPTERALPGAVKNLKPHEHVQKGRVITLLTEEEREQLRASGRPVRNERMRSGDFPIAKFLYLTVCQNQQNPVASVPGQPYPKPISETGLAWPKMVSH